MDPHPHSLAPAEYARLLDGLLDRAGAYALSILRNRADAEDAVQQAALRGLQRLNLYDTARPFRGWWFTLLRNCCMDLLRSHRPHVPLEQANAARAAVDTPGEWLDLAEVMERLDAGHEEILRLRYFAGLSYDELAQAMAIPKGTVMSRLHYARKALCSQMKGSRP